MSDVGAPRGRKRPRPERLPQREATRTTGGRWLLGCGLHTGKRKRERCPVCDAAHAETVAELTSERVTRYLWERERQAHAMRRRIEEHGTAAGGQPAVSRVNLSKGREYERQEKRR